MKAYTYTPLSKGRGFIFIFFWYSTKKNHHIPTTKLFHSCKRNPGKTLEIWVPSPPVTMAMTPDYNPWHRLTDTSVGREWLVPVKCTLRLRLTGDEIDNLSSSSFIVKVVLMYHGPSCLRDACTSSNIFWHLAVFGCFDVLPLLPINVYFSWSIFHQVNSSLNCLNNLT